METRQQGTVVWFNETVRYGFIARHSGKDVFVHAGGINGRGCRTLKKGQRVSFLLEHDHLDRPRAVEVSVIGEADLTQGAERRPSVPPARNSMAAANNLR
jgi:CspA family cold shock protein